MKKRIVFGIIAALALLFVLPGCSDPSNAIPLEKIANPGNLTVKAYDGMNLITWNRVIDARNYDVYRINTATKEEIRVANNINKTYLKDYVGYNNKMVNDVTYEYVVVAKSNKSTGTTNASSGIAVQNGVSRKSVKAIIPDTLTVTTPLPADITVVPFASDKKNLANQDMIVVTVSNIQPNYNYEITYTYGRETINRSFGDVNSTGDWSNNNEIIAKFPVIGGTNSINVTAYFGGFEFGYYNNAVAAVTSVPVVGKYKSIAAPTSFSAYKRIKEGIMLEWNNVPDATYAVYKVETDREVPVLTATTISSVNIISDWKPVTGTQVWNPAVTGTNKWNLLDTPADGKGNFIYAIIASIGEGENKVTSAPAYAVQGKYDTTVVTLTASLDNVDDEVTLGGWFGYDKDDYTFELSVIEVEPIVPDSTPSLTGMNFKEVGTRKPITISNSELTAGSLVYDVDEETSYLFRLSTTYNGLTTTVPEMTYMLINN